MFDSVAPHYDRLNRILSFGIDRLWRRTAVNQLKETSPKKILDVATGTGDLAFSALKLAPDKVVGVDLSEEMLARAREKADRYGVAERASFVRGDGEKMPFEDSSFDAALIGFGIRNYENPDAGLVEILRVLRPGGRLVVLEFSHPEGRLFSSIYGAYSRVVMPRIGRLFSRVKGPYTYLPDSIEAFPCGEAFLEKVRNAGFIKTTARRMTFGIASLYIGQRPIGSALDE